jgi:hypothetical protein
MSVFRAANGHLISTIESKSTNPSGDAPKNVFSMSTNKPHELTYLCMGKDTFEEISSMEWYFRGEFGNFEELLEIPCNGKVPLRYQDLIGMCCPLHELTLYRHCNEFN